MSNKNDFPSWLDAPDPGGDENDQQPENDGGDLPPWLNPQANAPQADADDDGGDLPPWLQGEDPPVVYNFGGAELSEEYLSGGDQLIDRHESDITYDEWVAQQAEDARPKSIDEEIPDLISDIPDTGALTGESTGGTGQLPEWFLGLEELDESEIPDWFKDAQEIEAPPSGAPGDLAPWMMDLVQTEPPPEPAQSAMLDDDVETFFSSMGSGFRLEEDEPVVDWFAATTGNEPTTTEEDDFFAQFGVKPPAPPTAPPPSAEPVLADDDWIEQSAPPTSTLRPSSDFLRRNRGTRLSSETENRLTSLLATRRDISLVLLKRASLANIERIAQALEVEPWTLLRPPEQATTGRKRKASASA